MIERERGGSCVSTERAELDRERDLAVSWGETAATKAAAGSVDWKDRLVR